MRIQGWLDQLRLRRAERAERQARKARERPAPVTAEAHRDVTSAQVPRGRY
jgi:hypothetical protein